MPFQPARLGLHFEIVTLAATEDSSRSFLMTKQILKSSQNCDACNNPMVLSPCAASKSADLYIWKCGRPCKKTKSVRSGFCSRVRSRVIRLMLLAKQSSFYKHTIYD